MNHNAVIADLRREREATVHANESYADTEPRHREQMEIAQQSISRGRARIMDIDRAIAALEAASRAAAMAAPQFRPETTCGYTHMNEVCMRPFGHAGDHF